MNETLIIIGSVILIYVLYDKTKGTNIKTDNNNNIIDNRKKLEKYIQSIIYKYNFEVTVPMVLAVINTESGLKNFDNNIVGDTTKQFHSFGIMQVSEPALADSSNTYNLNISSNDIKTDLKSNVLAGTAYLDICYRTAKKEVVPNEVVWFTFKKYNGGRNIGFNTRSSADVYADKTYKKFLELNN